MSLHAFILGGVFGLVVLLANTFVGRAGEASLFRFEVHLGGVRDNAFAEFLRNGEFGAGLGVELDRNDGGDGGTMTSEDRVIDRPLLRSSREKLELLLLASEVTDIFVISHGALLRDNTD